MHLTSFYEIIIIGLVEHVWDMFYTTHCVAVLCVQILLKLCYKIIKFYVFVMYICIIFQKNNITLKYAFERRMLQISTSLSV